MLYTCTALTWTHLAHFQTFTDSDFYYPNKTFLKSKIQKLWKQKEVKKSHWLRTKTEMAIGLTLVKRRKHIKAVCCIQSSSPKILTGRKLWLHWDIFVPAHPITKSEATKLVLSFIFHWLISTEHILLKYVHSTMFENRGQRDGAIIWVLQEKKSLK